MTNSTPSLHLTDKHCVPCEGGIPPLKQKEYVLMKAEIPDWRILNTTMLQRDFAFKNFKEALSFVNKVGELAEKEGHHPDLSIHNWNKVLISLTTHAIKGLSENDFILAAKIDRLLSS